jgi:hypothetical protein
VNRASQLDAEELDADLVSMLSQQASSVFQYFSPSFPSHYAPEIELALRLLIFQHTVAKSVASPGAELQGLILCRDTRGPSFAQTALSAAGSAASSLAQLLVALPSLAFAVSKGKTSLADAVAAPAAATASAPVVTRAAAEAATAPLWRPTDLILPTSASSPLPGLSAHDRNLYLLVSALLPYALHRWKLHLSAAGWGATPPSSLRARLFVATERLQLALRVLSVANALVFLCRGVYPSLAHRVLGLRYGWASARASGRSLAFDVMAQELLWRGLMEATTDLAPVAVAAVAALWSSGRGLATRVWHKWLAPPLPGTAAAAAAAAAAAEADADADADVDEGAAWAGSEAAGRVPARKDPGSGAVKTREGPVGGACSAECGALRAQTPYLALPCRHVYCYYCIRARRLAAARAGTGAPGLACPKCGVTVEGIAPAVAHAAIEVNSSN